jgi:hypothetical protein
LDEVSLRTYGGKKTSIPNRFCKLFDLHDDEKILAFLMKLSNNTHSDFGLSYLLSNSYEQSKLYYPFRDNLTAPILTWKRTNSELYY